MNISHISVSRKKCFDTCPAQYKFKYHLKVPPSEEPFYFTYGKLVHRSAEIYVQNKQKTDIEEIANDLLRGKIEFEKGEPCPCTELPADYNRKFKKHLKSIHNLTNKTGTDGETEYEFRYDLDPPNEKFVTGFIDRLIIRGEGENKKAFIIDYKTTKKSKHRVNKETVKYDLQLRMYSRVVQKDFNIKAENVKAALFFLEGENLIGCQYTEESLKEAESSLLEAYDTIKEADAEKVWGKVGWHCKYCDYAKICPFYNPTSKSHDSFDGNMDSFGDSWQV